MSDRSASHGGLTPAQMAGAAFGGTFKGEFVFGEGEGGVMSDRPASHGGLTPAQMAGAAFSGVKIGSIVGALFFFLNQLSVISPVLVDPPPILVYCVCLLVSCLLWWYNWELLYGKKPLKTKMWFLTNVLATPSILVFVVYLKDPRLL